MREYLKKIIRRLGDNFNFTVSKQPTIIGKYREKAIDDALNHFEPHFIGSNIFNFEEEIRNFAINKAIELNTNDDNDFYLEFGVFKGNSINYFSKYLQKVDSTIYGFDSFEGLEENWTGTHHLKNIAFNLKGQKPKTNRNVVIIEGKIQKTLLDFCNTKLKNNKINFIHFDFDTFTPTDFTLRILKNNLKKNTIILFDEIYGFPNWRDHEYKALINNLSEDKYKFIAFSEKQAVIQIL
jgi:hypothetical protein